MSKALFISDLHLCDEAPERLRAFDALMVGPALQADALYILGDLFEYWAGDDDETPLAEHVAHSLRGLADNGIRVFFLAGNRDFLIGQSYAERAEFTLLDDHTLIELDEHPVLLCHGDTLCTSDLAYQEYRDMVRAPEWQQSFLARPLTERRAIIDELRQRSQEANREKPEEIMDVHPAAVEALLRAHGYPTLIHGHTHRPARHQHVVDGNECVRWVLSDWDDSAPYLLWDGTAFVTGEQEAEPERSQHE